MTARAAERDRGRAIDEPPPFLGTWGRVYAAVALYLLSVITLLYLFTRFVST